MKKIIYIANIRLPTEKAHGVQVMKTCESLARKGVDVLLAVPTRGTGIAGDPFGYYGVEKNFRIRRFPSLDTVRFGYLGFLLQSLTFIVSCVFFFSREDGSFYSRDESTAWIMSILGKRCVWESHRGETNFFTRSLIRRGAGIVAISDGLKELYVSLGAKPENIIVVRDGVDVEEFSIPISKTEAREKVGLPSATDIVLYTGHLYEWKGADILARAAARLPDTATAVFVGGTDDELAAFRGKYAGSPRIMILGRKLHSLIPYYLKAADVLVLPNSGKEDISRLYTSPLKLFEYMASGRPIVASRLPSICEVLNEENAILVSPDDPADLAAGIASALADEEKASALSRKALEEVKKYSWAKRAGAITSFIYSK